MRITSKAQWKYMAIKHPDILHKAQKETPVNFKKLPNIKKKKK